MSEYKKVGYTFAALDRDVISIVDQINYDQFKPTLIVGLSRGGLIPAVMISHRLGTPMVPIVWQTRDGDTKQWAELEYHLSMHDRVLIVDDICDSGQTLREIDSKIKTICQGWVDVQYATLLYNQGCVDLVPRYVGMCFDRRQPTQSNVWWQFAWE